MQFTQTHTQCAHTVSISGLHFDWDCNFLNWLVNNENTLLDKPQRALKKIQKRSQKTELSGKRSFLRMKTTSFWSCFPRNRKDALYLTQRHKWMSQDHSAQQRDRKKFQLVCCAHKHTHARARVRTPACSLRRYHVNLPADRAAALSYVLTPKQIT